VKSSTNTSNDKDPASSVDHDAASTSTTATAGKTSKYSSSRVWDHFKKHDSKLGKATCRHCKKLMAISVSTVKYRLECQTQRKYK
jgi:hypothetical protein